MGTLIGGLFHSSFAGFTLLSTEISDTFSTDCSHHAAHMLPLYFVNIGQTGTSATSLSSTAVVFRTDFPHAMSLLLSFVSLLSIHFFAISTLLSYAVSFSPSTQ